MPAKPKKLRLRSHGFVVTLNNPTVTLEDYVEQWKHAGAETISAQLERGNTTRTLHIQLFARFHNQRALKSL